MKSILIYIMTSFVISLAMALPIAALLLSVCVIIFTYKIIRRKIGEKKRL